MIQGLAHRPILLRIGLLLGLVVILALVSMASSVLVARATAGLAAAVNQSGSLRMQSYRIGMALADRALPPVERAERVARLAGELETRLASPRLADAIPRRADHEVRAAYQRVWDSWRDRMRPPLLLHLHTLRSGSEPTGQIAYLDEVDGFVAEIHGLVGLLEQVAEGRIGMLRQIQGLALLFTVLAVTVTLAIVVRRVIVPLGELLACADRARRGDFSGRTRFTGDDELGRLGSAMNLMGRDLSGLYRDLEERVAAKTLDLARTNRSLELLYRVGTRLGESAVSEPLLQRVLVDIRDRLGLEAVTLCLQSAPDGQGDRLRVTTRTSERQQGACFQARCPDCREGESQGPLDLPSEDGREGAVASFPLAERDERSGALVVGLRPGQVLDRWQSKLLATLAGNLGTALDLHRRQRESRRLALHEERGILARELHDSLAQSLSYLKIQAARLSAALDRGDGERAQTVLGELRQGIGSAYRQLRELLATFRLKMDDRGLQSALTSTLEEYRWRGLASIELDNRLPAALLTPNEEIHVLQIVREALSNVARHAQASHVWVRLAPKEGGVEVEVSDDGCGMRRAGGRAGHYGLDIMRERALTLGGTLTVESPPTGGTRVRLGFRHRPASDPDGRVADRIGEATDVA